jgi:hypothetical protein
MNIKPLPCEIPSLRLTSLPLLFTCIAGALLLSTPAARAALPPGNLLANPSGMAAPDSGWTILAGPPAASTGWGRATAGGADVLPGYFITSWSPVPCKRSQTIDLLAKGATAEELDAAPDLTVEESIASYAGNGTVADNFYIKVELRGAAQNVISSFTIGTDTARVNATSSWTKYEHTFTGYGPGVRYVYFEDGGWDGGNWSGQYGTYHDAAKVQFSNDSDGDGLPDAEEEFYAFLDKNNPDDALEDGDGDGYANIDEYLAGLDMGDTDTDNDNASDGDEFNVLGTNPLLPDSDGDGLLDGDEVNDHGSDPLLTDTDGDFFQDGDEVAKGSLPTSSTSTPGGIVITSQPGLLGSDLTDPTNTGVGTTGTGSGFDWSAITTSGTASFTGEGAYSVFDNLAPGGSGSKWCCPTLPTAAGFHHITVGFNTTANTDILTSLDYFTVTSANDAPDRQPRIWEIQGSMNGTTFETIVRFDSPKSFWKLDNQTLRFDLPKGSLPYRYLRFAVFAINAGTQFQLDEIEYFGEQTNADADGDGIPKLYEDYYAFLSDSDPNDAAGDQDGDGLDNLGEYDMRTNPALADTDGDGLNDGDEITAGANPLVADSDADGLADGAEVNTHGTDPTLVDTDADNFSDGYEIARSSDPVSSSSTPDGVVVEGLGFGTAALLTSDFTDRENNISDATAAGTGFDWVSSAATNKPDFRTAEGALNVFDNKVAGGEAKWCCDPPSVSIPAQSVTVRMPYPIALTHFTMASSEDAPERDPRKWSIQGSNDGTNFTTIFVQDDAKMSFWGTNRLYVMKFTLAAPAPVYKWFRYSVTATNSTMHSISEIEYFGIDQDTDGDGMPDYWEARYPALLDPAVADAAGDQDTDGLTNLQEFQHGTTPGDTDSDDDWLGDGSEIAQGSDPLGPKVLSFSKTGNTFTLTMKVYDVGKKYKLRRSSTLNNDFADIGNVFSPATDTQLLTDTAAPAGKAFYLIERVP